MNVGIAYANGKKHVWLKIDVPDQSTVQDVINLSGLLEQFPDIDLGQQKVGIFGRLAKLEATVEEGDRVEIYRPITADPDTVERRDQN